MSTTTAEATETTSPSADSVLERSIRDDWSREVGDPRYVVDLLARIVTVSVRTAEIVDGLPALETLADQDE